MGLSFETTKKAHASVGVVGRVPLLAALLVGLLLIPSELVMRGLILAVGSGPGIRLGLIGSFKLGAVAVDLLGSDLVGSSISCGGNNLVFNDLFHLKLKNEHLKLVKLII